MSSWEPILAVGNDDSILEYKLCQEAPGTDLLFAFVFCSCSSCLAYHSSSSFIAFSFHSASCFRELASEERKNYTNETKPVQMYIGRIVRRKEILFFPCLYIQLLTSAILSKVFPTFYPNPLTLLWSLVGSLFFFRRAGVPILTFNRNKPLGLQLGKQQLQKFCCCC